MPLIYNSEIDNLVILFQKRGVKFYHACQYKDFKTYLQLGGVPSRNLMESSKLPYTIFDTDTVDKNNAVWEKVFGNIADFGIPFAFGKRNDNTAPTPNPYGPILLVFMPQVFYEASDIGICLRSAGGRDFNRISESISICDIDRIFQYKIEDAPNNYAKYYIKFSDALKQEFNDPQAISPEVSCSVPNEKLSFNHLEKIIVDSYTFNQKMLLISVARWSHQYKLQCAIEERRYSKGKREIKRELANLLLHDFIPIRTIATLPNISESLKDWANRILRGEIDWQYDRFARYLRSGTILELNNE